MPAELINASYTLGAGRWQVIRKVIVPYSVPGLIDAMRVNIAATWNLVVVAELIAATGGPRATASPGPSASARPTRSSPSSSSSG